MTGKAGKFGPMIRSALLVLLFTTAAGCLPTMKFKITDEHYANLSAGEIGCPAEELKISNAQNDFAVRPGDGQTMKPWVAECRGHRFICGASGRDAVSCTEELKPAAASISEPQPAPAAAAAD
jgi:hypothetical protein